MMQKNIDQSIKDAFLDLCCEKGIAGISVSELTCKANINRCTFYLHYESLDDLIWGIENELIEDLTRYSVSQVYLGRMDRYLWYHNALKSLVCKTMENFDLFSTLLSPKGDPDFSSKVYGFIEKETIRKYDCLYLPKDNTFEYIVSGAMGIFSHWMKTGANLDPDKVTSLMLLPARKILMDRESF